MSDIIKDFIEQKNINSYEQLISKLKDTSLSELKLIVKESDDMVITPANIPQYSNYDNATINLISYLRKSGNFGPDFAEVGRHYLISKRTDLAYKKYGENHSKTAVLLGLATLTKDSLYKVYLSRLGLLVEREPIEKQKELIQKLAIGIPIIQKSIKSNFKEKEQLVEVLKQYLSESTALRRLGNCWYLYQPFLEGAKL